VGYALPPTKVKSNGHAHQIAKFWVSDEDFRRIARSSPAAGEGERKVRAIDETSRMFRLRCCEIPAKGFTDGTWAVAENRWPREIVYQLNGVQLYTRRKLQHGRYLPIDLTEHVKAGPNKLELFINRKAGDKPFRYAVAVEAIGISSHLTIKSHVSRVSAKESLGAIKKSLSAAVTTDDDDDLAITSSNMSISLVDPYTNSRLVDMPVRGVDCLHKDVFDLDTFLSVCARDGPDAPSGVDCWRCPLCRGDVRPQNLILDEFLLGVRAELASRGLRGVRSIVVEPNGSWTPKVEVRTGVRSESLDRDEHMHGMSVPHEVVEWD
jgi:hypothetical protein